MLELMGRAALTSLGFFWKAGWAFVMGYAVSAMIQAFVPKKHLVRHMGGADVRSVGLATVFGAASSSCSFAALAAARSLIAKGASFMAGVAFMFASTNLVIELGILIFLFLGWQYLAAELAGGLLLIAVSSLLIGLTAPRPMVERMRRRLDAMHHEQDFDWRERVTSLRGWRLVGRAFVMEWGMVWREILFGFTLAGAVAVFVPRGVWEAIFLQGLDGIPDWLRLVENVLAGPLVAAMTFIGSMGNIPLATVLAANGVSFAGIMAFIYSDLMVPPLVAVNARYYGWRAALYIAGVMFASIVVTALTMQGLYAALGAEPRTTRVVEEVARFGLDYTLWLNAAFALVAGALVRLSRSGGGHGGHADHGGHDHEMRPPGALKRWSTRLALAWLILGLSFGQL